MEIASLTPRGNGKVGVSYLFLDPILWNFIGYVLLHLCVLATWNLSYNLTRMIFLRDKINSSLKGLNNFSSKFLN